MLQTKAAIAKHTVGPSVVEASLLTDRIALSSEPKQPFPSAGSVPDRNRKKRLLLLCNYKHWFLLYFISLIKTYWQRVCVCLFSLMSHFAYVQPESVFLGRWACWMSPLDSRTDRSSFQPCYNFFSLLSSFIRSVDWDSEASHAFQKSYSVTVTISVQITEPQTKSSISELTVQIKFGFKLIYSPPWASLLSGHWLIFISLINSQPCQLLLG